MSLGEARKRQIKIGANKEKKGEFWENRKWKIYGRKNRRCQVREREKEREWCIPVDLFCGL